MTRVYKVKITQKERSNWSSNAPKYLVEVNAQYAGWAFTRWGAHIIARKKVWKIKRAIKQLPFEEKVIEEYKI